MSAPGKATDGGLLVGIEQEFALLSDGAQLDFRDRFEAAKAGPHVPFHGRDDAVLVDRGFVISADGAEAEIATIPIPLPDFSVSAVVAELARIRKEAIEVFHEAGADRILGYSTHLNFSVPEGQAPRIAWALSRHAAPGLILALETRISDGIFIRPRGDRVEIGSDYLDGQELSLAISLLAGSVQALTELDGVPKDVPRIHLRRFEPATHRPGIFLPLNAFGSSVHKLGREASVELAGGGVVEAQEVLSAWSHVAAETLEATDADHLSPLLQGEAVLAIDRQPADRGRIREDATLADPLPLALKLGAVARQPGLAFLDWRGAVVSREQDFVVVPRDKWGLFGTDSFDGWMASLSESEHKLDSLGLLSAGATFSEADEDALKEEARTGKGNPPTPIGLDPPPGIILWPCFISVTVYDEYLCPGDFGIAIAEYWPFGQLQWTLSPELLPVTPLDQWFVIFRAIRGGCPKVTCTLYTAGAECSDTKDLSVPEGGLITADEQPIRCIGVAGHAPGIVIETPVPSGSADEEAPVTYISGDDDDSYVGSVSITGRVVDPLGYTGVTVATSDALGLTPSSTSVGVDDAGRFSIEARVQGLGPKRLVLRSTGVSGGVGVAVLAGSVDFGPELEATYEETAQQLSTAYAERAAKSKKMLFGPPTPPPLLDEAAFADLQQPIEDLLEERDTAEDDAVVQALQSARGFWNIGATNAHLQLEPASRKRILIFDCKAAPGVIATLEGHDFTLEEGVNALVSVDPEAFVAVETDHDGERIPPEEKDILVQLDIPDEADDTDPVTIGYRDCSFLAGFPFKVKIEGVSHCLLYQPALLLDDASPVTAIAMGIPGEGGSGASSTSDPDVRRVPARLEANFEGVCSVPKKYEWQVVYGPGSARLETSGDLEETCSFSTAVPGLYLVEAKLISDHDDPLAAAVFEVEALELGLRAGITVNESDVTVVEGSDYTHYRVSLDTGDEVEAFADAVVRSDTGRPPVVVQRMEKKLHWVRRQFGRNQDHFGTERRLRYMLAPEIGGIRMASVQINEIEILDRYGELVVHDVTSLGVRRDMVLETTAGTAVEVLARAHSAGSTAPDFRQLREYDRTLTDVDPAQLATLFEDLAIGDPRVVYLQLRALDRMSNPVDEGTPVTIQALGTARVRRPDQVELMESQVFEADANGEVLVLMEVPSDTPGHALLRIEVETLVFFVGNPVGAVDFDLRPDGVTTFGAPGGIRVGLREGDAKARLRVRFNQVGVTEGSQVVARIADGAIRSSPGNLWKPEIRAQTRADGYLSLYLTPRKFNPDGTEHWWGGSTWGDTTLLVQVGTCTETFHVHFESIASVVKLPKARLPKMTLVRQDDFELLDPPSDLNSTGSPVPYGRLQAENGRDVLLELHEQLEAELEARFVFDAETTDEVNPDVDSGTQASVSGSLPARLSEDIDRGGTVPSVRATVDDQVVSATGRKSLRLSEPWVGALWNSYAAPVTGCAGFQLAFRVRVTVQERWDILRVEGSLADGRVATNLGALRVSVEGSTARPLLLARYTALGCARAEARAHVAVPINRNEWIEVQIEVAPSLRENEVTIRLKTSLGQERENIGPNFNMLAGDTYWIALGPPDDGEAHVEDIKWLLPRAYALHLKRDDGLLTPWLHVHMVGDDIPMPFERSLNANRQAPSFATSVETFGSFTVGYCDAPEYRRVDIGALDVLAEDTATYVGDTFSGFVVGESETVAGFAADFAAGMLGWGDLRDMVKQLAYLSPGGEKFNTAEFGLAATGLALDVAQIGAPQSAAPNAVLSVIKILLKRVEPFLSHPGAREITRILSEVALKVLRKAYDLRLLHGAGAFFTIELVRDVVPDGIWEWFFSDISTEDLDAIARFGKAITPSFSYASAIDRPAAIAEVIAHGDAQRLNDLMERLWARVELVSEFFNPAWKNFYQLDRVLRFLTKLRKVAPAGVNIDDEILEMVKQANTWRFGGGISQKQAREWLLKSIDVLESQLDELSEALTPKAFRGFLGFTLGCGPHRAEGLLGDLKRVEGLSTSELNDYFEWMHDCAEITFRTTRGEVHEQLLVLNRLFSGLYIVSPDEAVRRSARLGVDGMRRTMQRFAGEIRDDLRKGALNPYDNRGRELLDVLLKEGAAIESKAMDGAISNSSFRRAVDGIVGQFVESLYRIADEGLDVREIRYCIYITGDTAHAMARFAKIRKAVLAESHQLVDMVPVPRLRFVPLM